MLFQSFFGRSYNNLSSISECKNNGECIINKKNRTACKACRLRKCLLVGMSKSGSRYGRRSNWFKIHCLLQEQQQQQAAAHNSQKPLASSLSPNTFNLMGHPSFAPGLFPRPPCTKEELMLLGIDEYKHPVSTASPSISSPDSHNSDSSIEIADKRNSLLNFKSKQLPPNTTQQNSIPINKLDFLPLPFAGLPFGLPPPGFLPPPTHLLFSNYHNALYQHHNLQIQQQHQGLLLKTTDLPKIGSPPQVQMSSSSPPLNSYETNQDDLTKSENQQSKRFFLDAVLESQKLPKRSLSPVTSKDCQIDNDLIEGSNMEQDEELTITPPRSPKSPNVLSVFQYNPIDLSMKSTSSTKSDSLDKIHLNEKNCHKPKNSSDDDGVSNNGFHSDNDSDDNKTSNNNNIVDFENNMYNYKSKLASKKNNDKRYSFLSKNETEEDKISNYNNNNDSEYTVEIKKKKLQHQPTTPLDLTLTTKV